MPKIFFNLRTAGRRKAYSNARGQVVGYDMVGAAEGGEGQGDQTPLGHTKALLREKPHCVQHHREIQQLSPGHSHSGPPEEPGIHRGIAPGRGCPGEARGVVLQPRRKRWIRMKAGYAIPIDRRQFRRLIAV